MDKGPHVPSKAPASVMDAFQALEHGTANEGQQKTALSYLINGICRTYDMSYRPGDDGRRATDFAEGKRSVGLEVITMLKVNTSIIRRNEDEIK